MRVPVLVLPDLLCAVVMDGTCRLINRLAPLPRLAVGQQVLVACAEQPMRSADALALARLVEFAAAAGSWSPDLPLRQAAARRGRIVGSAVLGPAMTERDLRGKTVEAWFVGPYAWPLTQVTPAMQLGPRIAGLREGLHWLDGAQVMESDH